MALSPQWLDELRSRTTLSALIMRSTKLQRAGREWKGCCPFHDEKTPSFTVNDAKGFYHCFGCGAHGDAIRWMTDQRGMQFMDAVKELAAAAGMDVPAPDPQAAKRAVKRASLHDVMAAAQEWFVANLWSPDGLAARDYLQRRGLDEKTVRKFGFGWAPDNKGALKSALSRFDEAMLVEAGLLISVEDKAPYDRFRGRVMLPIQDARERVIAFGGRILESRDGVAKYLNSPDTPLFDKGRTLYNIHRAAVASRKTGRLIAVEGYMDAIALATHGIEDVVAPMGTALTEQQIEMMWRLVDKPVLCFDGDNAGQRAAMRAVSRALPMLRPGHSLQIVEMPAGLDPDDLLQRQGRAAMEKLVGEATGLLEFLWQKECEESSISSADDRVALEQKVLDYTSEIQHPLVKSHYVSALKAALRKYFWQPWNAQKVLKNAEDVIEVEGRIVYRKFDDSVHQQSQERIVRGELSDGLTRAVIAGFARHPAEVERHAESLLALAQTYPVAASAIDWLLDNAARLEAGENPPISTGTIPPPPDNARFSFLVEGSDPGDAREDLAEALALLVEKPALDRAIAAATDRFERDPEGAFAEQQRLRKRKLEIDVRLGQMARKRAAQAAGEDNGNDNLVHVVAEQETD